MNHLVPWSRQRVAVAPRDRLGAARHRSRRCARSSTARSSTSSPDRGWSAAARSDRSAPGCRSRAACAPRRRSSRAGTSRRRATAPSTWTIANWWVRACAPNRRLVARGDHAVPRREHLRLAPQRRDLDLVDPLAPGVPLGEHRLVAAIGELLRVALDRELTERAELGARSRGRTARSTTRASDRRRTGCRGEEAVERTPWDPTWSGSPPAAPSPRPARSRSP